MAGRGRRRFLAGSYPECRASGEGDRVGVHYRQVQDCVDTQRGWERAARGGGWRGGAGRRPRGHETWGHGYIPPVDVAAEAAAVLGAAVEGHHGELQLPTDV